MTDRPWRESANKRVMESPVFIRACQIAKVEPCKRQASKWNNHYGAAYAVRLTAAQELAQEMAAETAAVKAAIEAGAA